MGRVRLPRQPLTVLLGPAPASGPHPAGPAIAFALTGAKATEREVLLEILALDPGLLADRPPPTLLADRNYYGRNFETRRAESGVTLLRPARKGEPERAGAELLVATRPLILDGHTKVPDRAAQSAMSTP